MIIFPQCGRLGNQLFQYQGIRKYFQGHQIIFCGFDQLYSSCDDLAGIFPFLESSTLRPLLKYASALLILFARVRLLSQIVEDTNTDHYQIFVRRGIIWNILVPINVFFQHSDTFGAFNQLPKLRSSLRDKAYGWLIAQGIDPLKELVVFLHVRRGDYLTWPSKSSPAALNLSWYSSAINFIQHRYGNCIFLAMGDDPLYLYDVFDKHSGFLISENSPSFDLALMSWCSHGILSASSFAWWGAMYSKSLTSLGSCFLAPRYWAGHRSKEWFPCALITDKITFID